MIKRNEIDSHIGKLLSYLESIQNYDGSFDTMYIQPFYNPDKGWMKVESNAPSDIAYCLIPLLQIQSNEASQIVEKGADFILSKSFKKKLWAYAALSNKYLHFYDTESTALCSYILEKSRKHQINNKILLDQFVNNQNSYNLFIDFHKPLRQLSFVSQIKLYIHNLKVKKGSLLKDDIMRIDDCEFSVTCNNLLYIGKTKTNKSVWAKLKKDFIENNIKRLYYPTVFHCIYCYSRLCGYGNYLDMIPEKNIINQYISELYAQLKKEEQPLHRVLLGNSILFFDVDLREHTSILNKCLSDISEDIFRRPTPMFSSNINTDCQPDKNLPNTYFGSSAITCSLYIEFLNLYRKRFYGSYYGQD